MGATIGKESLVSSLVSLGSSGGHHCVMIGLDSSGKTTILYRLKHGQYTNTAPTIGFNCEKVRKSSSRHGMASHLCVWKSVTNPAEGCNGFNSLSCSTPHSLVMRRRFWRLTARQVILQTISSNLHWHSITPFPFTTTHPPLSVSIAELSKISIDP